MSLKNKLEHRLEHLITSNHNEMSHYFTGALLFGTGGIILTTEAIKGIGYGDASCLDIPYLGSQYEQLITLGLGLVSMVVSSTFTSKSMDAYSRR